MPTETIHSDDLQIAAAMLNRDEQTTRLFFYKQCYPLFSSLYRRFVTDCDSCLEFMNEIYLLIMTPGVKTGRCALQGYRGDSSLRTWLRKAALNYCYGKYQQVQQHPFAEPVATDDANPQDGIDILQESDYMTEPDYSRLYSMDVERLLAMMPNDRYRQLIRLRYLHELSNEETAVSLGMTMAQYYNNHLRAKAQFERVLHREQSQRIVVAFDAVDNLCDIRCEMWVMQQFALSVLESDLITQAQSLNWLTPNGVQLRHIGCLAASHGLLVDRSFDGTLTSLDALLQSGSKVMVALDVSELGADQATRAWQDLQQGRTPNHVVVVQSVEHCGDDTSVTLFDPATSELFDTYPSDQFLDAWDDSENFYVSIRKDNGM